MYNVHIFDQKNSKQMIDKATNFHKAVVWRFQSPQSQPNNN